MLDAQEQIRKFQDFCETTYKTRIVEAVSKGKNFIEVDFSELTKDDPELAEDILNNPEESLKAFEFALENLNLVDNFKNFRIRLADLPHSANLMIRNIRSSNLGKLYVFEGIVRQKSDVRPQVTSSRFECPACGQIISVLQIDTSFREPQKCGCGRKGRFNLLSKELVDAQGIVLEESPEMLEGGEQPKRINIFLKEDLVSPITEKKTNPGSKVKVVGTVKDVPYVLKSGGRSTRFDLLVEANNIRAVEESFYDIEVSREEEEQIKELAQDPKIYEKMIDSIAPSIYGYNRVKEALVLQLMGGVQKKRTDGVVSRGDIHVLLVGDPGCIAGDSQVALIYKGMEKIKNFGNAHLQPIREIVTKIRKHEKDKYYDFATVFQHYRGQPVLRVITETGKEVTCTYNQPFLTKTGWKRADEILLGTKIRVMPKIPATIKKLAPTNFARVGKKSGVLKKVSLPNEFTPELASLCGYVIGDGNIHKNGYRVTCYINEQETDLIGALSGLWEKTFNVKPQLYTKNNEGSVKTIDDGSGLLRQIVSLQKMFVLEVNSRQIASSLSFLANKRVPQQIFQSPKYVVAKFISWLFEADGCAFSKGRGRTSVQLKSATPGLLKDVQLLLLYFGIQSRIIEDNLCIRRSHDIELFAENIGFISQKKKERLINVLEDVKTKSDTQKRKRPQRWEKIADIIPAGVMDVYDFEVPVSNMFIANGIVCHNSGKSQLLKRISSIAPKGRYVSGKGVSGAGLTAAVVRDEFLGGWSLEAGALVLANNGICCIDEMDKMSNEDRGAMHEALEQQTISISKANIQATLLARTTVLAAANPQFGRFDPYGVIAEQINLPPTLINRFDLIFPIKDLPDEGRDERMAKHILNLHQTPDVAEPEIKTALLKKYFAYARQRVFPRLTDIALNEIKDFYVKMRNRGSTDERAARAIPISARQLEALVRMAEASAKVRLSDRVSKRDARRAIDLLTYCLLQIGVDKETGMIDIDRIATGIPASQRDKIFYIKEIIAELETRLGKVIPADEVVRAVSSRGITEAEVEEVIEKLKRSGDIYEPRHGFIQKL